LANVLEIDLQLVKVSDWSVCIYPVNALFIVASVGFIMLCTMLILLSKLHFCSSVAALDVVVSVGYISEYCDWNPFIPSLAISL